MKKKSLLLASALFLSSLSILTFTSCDSDTLSYLDVKVVKGGTNSAISGANVTVRPPDSSQGSNGNPIDARTGVTNELGMCQFSYAAPLLVKVTASKEVEVMEQLNDSISYPTMKTITSAAYTTRLKENEVVELKVELNY